MSKGMAVGTPLMNASRALAVSASMMGRDASPSRNTLTTVSPFSRYTVPNAPSPMIGQPSTSMLRMRFCTLIIVVRPVTSKIS